MTQQPFSSPQREPTMQRIAWTSPLPAVGSGFSVVMAERILREADTLDLPAAWDRLGLGHPSRRVSAYPARHRLAAVLAGLACGLKGSAPGNTFLRPNTALQARLSRRFPDPGNQTLMSQLPGLLEALDTVIPRADRDRVLLRGDAHLGTIGNLRDCRRHGYHYLCPLQSWSAVKRLRAAVQGRRGGRFEETDSAGRSHRVQFWVVPRWQLRGKGKQRRLVTRATVYCDRVPGQQERWTVLVSD